METTQMHYAVNFYGDSTKKLHIVPENWLLDTKNTFPYESFSFYHENGTTAFVPARHILSQFIDFNYNDKRFGFVYKVHVLKKIGESVNSKKK
jgi:hypothetical protein